ncbi:Gfo/Idh/MocA family protein [Sediminibacillus albus]|uniref:Predicted dehydrogenase n=1 Tax=Sediminibacillus albus TaxID=407036 RepID=A0A1G8YK29_9BACI|nr:Predicted dehydrogenase [Sediminibacillus albus]
MEKVKWGILSTAGIGQKQVIPAIGRAANAEAIAIASRGDKAKEAAVRHNIAKAYTSYQELLQDPEIDAVYIPLPNSLHKQWVIEAARHGKHVLCEKPAALNVEELQEMIEACSRHGVKFMEAFMYQFHPLHEKVRELIDAKEIGELSLVRASFSFLLEKDAENIRLNNALGGGSVYDVGCYCLHSIRTVLGEEPVQIHAHAKWDDHLNVDTTVAGTMSFASGIEAGFDCSFDQFPENKYELVGSAGKIEVINAYRPDKNPDGEGLIRLTKAGGELIEKRIPGDQYRSQVEHFSKSILEDTPLYYSDEKMLLNMKVIDACYQSIHTGKVVRIAEERS